MKWKYIHLLVLIQGTKQPGNNIDAYIQVMKEEIGTLWHQGEEVWDNKNNELFNMRALLFIFMQDYPGVTVKGHCGCVWFQEE